MLDLETIFNPDASLTVLLEPTSVRQVISPEGALMVLRSWTELPGDWLIDFEERAAVREYDGNQAREHAEAEAFKEILSAMRRAGWTIPQGAV